MAHAGGRPPKFPECSARFLKHIEKGKTIASAAALSGLAESTVFAWLAEARQNPTPALSEFLETFTRARGLAQDKLVSQIREAGVTDWRALCWLAERMFPEQFNLRQFEPAVSVNVNATANAGPPQLDAAGMKARYAQAQEYLKQHMEEFKNNGNGNRSQGPSRPGKNAAL